MIRVLFLDSENGTRSQMAEALLNKIGGADFFAFSAGLKAGFLNEYAVKVMHEEGMDISEHGTKEIMKFIRTGDSFQYIIVLCSEKELESSAVLPAAVARLHWKFSDPKKFEGTDSEITEQFRQLRNMIKKVVTRFVKEIETGHSHIDADLNFEPAIR